MSRTWWIGSIVGASVLVVATSVWILVGNEAQRRARFRAVVPWLLVVVIGSQLATLLHNHVNLERAGETIVWRSPRAGWLALGALLVGVIAFHLQRRRSAALGYSQVALVQAKGLVAWLSDLPAVLRVLAIACLAVGLMRPETFRTVKYEEDSIDIMIVFDMSKSMEETDLPRDRMDAAQRVVRRFLRQTKHDRVGLVVFGQQAMLRCPLTQDAKLVEQIVRDLVIGDVPALGTAIGDGLALALAQLRRADGLCDPTPGSETKCAKEMSCSTEGYCVGPKRNKVVILLSDGDTNWVTRFEPDEAAQVAKDMGVQVYTVLVGREENNFFGGMSVNPATLRSVASLTGGEFFRATDYDTFDKGFQAVRKKLDKIKRIREERIPDKQLFVPFVVLAAILFGLDLLLSHTRMRRLP